ncbi:hypothetical protein JTE90_027745 [Oedothorax gibbosus]|uniref:Uncharacterized protein n=1 Tax=Oedothorax gibbosus TaxID=931172 RepID=A0AAV6TE09_9ARAC|nr:hypothetical protein JTE90_027745 [Oedothorax gibbosus]
MSSSDCLEHQHLSWVLMKRLASDALAGRLVHPTAPFLLPKYAPGHSLSCLVRIRHAADFLSPDLKFEIGLDRCGPKAS